MLALNSGALEAVSHDLILTIEGCLETLLSYVSKVSFNPRMIWEDFFKKISKIKNFSVPPFVSIYIYIDLYPLSIDSLYLHLYILPVLGKIHSIKLKEKYWSYRQKSACNWDSKDLNISPCLFVVVFCIHSNFWNL